MLRAALQTGFFLLLLGAALFGSAGRFDWPMAWAFLLVFAAFAIAAFLLLDPELIRERGSMRSGIKGWDLLLASVSFVGLYPGTLVVAGLDAARFGWSPPIPLLVQIGALALFGLGYGFAFWAMRANPFFSTFVRIQEERGHRVVVEGPYAFVRHPGYSGAIVAHLALPLALGSLWALAPGLCGVVLFIGRTAREDKTLEQELFGYRDYQRDVRWRLIPGLW